MLACMFDENRAAAGSCLPARRVGAWRGTELLAVPQLLAERLEERLRLSPRGLRLVGAPVRRLLASHADLLGFTLCVALL